MPEPVPCATCELHAEAVFRVEGMDCNEEVVILERRLKPLDGMEAIAADLIGQRLHVKYDAARLTTSAMVDAVGQTGMRMWLEHDEPLAGRVDRVAVASDGRGRRCARARGGRCDARSARRGQRPGVAGAVAGGMFPARRALTAIRARTVTSMC